MTPAGGDAITFAGRRERLWTTASGVVLGLQLCLILLTFRDYGMSWDQPTTHDYGATVVRYYATWGADEAALKHWLHPYGGLFEVAAFAVEKATGLGWAEGRNLTSALFGLLGVYAAMRLGRAVFGPLSGFLSGLFLVLTPVYYGHSFMNPKDLPFAALVLMAVWQIVRLEQSLPEWHFKRILGAGCWIGLAMGVRVGGGILFGVLGMTLLSHWWLGRRRAPECRPLPVVSAILVFALCFAIAWGCMLLCWPYALKAPLTGPYLAFAEFSKFWWDGEVLFEGTRQVTGKLPWYYLIAIFVRTMPEFILLGLFLGVLAWRLRSEAEPGSGTFWSTPGLVAILTAGILPIAAVLVLRSNVYDGLRHVLFAVPPFIILSAAGLVAFGQLRWMQPHRHLLGATVSGLMFLTVLDLRSLHPYQYIYFNRLVAGGIETANRSYDLEYWATALREAALWSLREFEPNFDGVIYYKGSAEPEQLSYYLENQPGRRRFQRSTSDEQKPRLIFVIRRGRQDSELRWGKLLHVVRRQGVPLVEVVEVP